MNEVEFAYVAGIIDGEGCIAVHQSNKHKAGHIPDHNLNLVVTVVSTDIGLIQWLKEKVGGNITYRQPQKENHKKSFGWHVYGASAARVLKGAYSYLITKREHAALGIEFQGYKVAPRKPIECARQWTIKNRLHQLSTKGPKAKT